MTLRLTYLALSSALAVMRLLPMSKVDKEIKVLTLRHQLTVLQRQINRPRITTATATFLAAILHWPPGPGCSWVRSSSPDTVPRWHRDFMRRRHDAAPLPPLRDRGIRLISAALIARASRVTPTVMATV
ncbi:hypothetical protein AB0O76_34205 [Streptomyces sp. NPDC086554]|uniref:hypothetical protein n=1 Tax=Streptomyces sp. NPDC086554 TaxID=3154864 RepID=UPI00342304AA